MTYTRIILNQLYTCVCVVCVICNCISISILYVYILYNNNNSRYFMVGLLTNNYIIRTEVKVVLNCKNI